MTVQPEIIIEEVEGVEVVRVLEPGTVWLVDDGAPSSGDGKHGDMYLDAGTGDVWGPKTTSGWGLTPSTNISPRELPETGNTGDILVKTSTGVAYTNSPTVDKLSYGLTANETVTTGQVAWNVDEGTLELGKIGGITNYLGQETMILCRNNSNSVTIPKGAAVMFAGTVGNSGRLKVAPMVSNGTYPGYVLFGVTDQAIAGGSDGYVTTFGKIRGINTAAYVDGDILWCDPTTPGGFTKTEPQAPNLKLAVAAVISAGNNGSIIVRATTGARLSDLHDVEANDAKNEDDVLHWTGTRWESTNRLTLLEQRVAALET